MKEISIVITVLLSVLLLPFVKLEANSYCRTSGNRVYCASKHNYSNIYRPIVETQARHTQNIASTTLHVSNSNTQSYTASASLSYSFTANVIFTQATVTGALGVSYSSSSTVSSGVSYTIPISTISGLYRIEHVMPSYSVSFLVLDLEGTLLSTPKIVNQSQVPSNFYYRLYRYAS